MGTILDHRRAELDGRIVLLQEQIDACTEAFEADIAARTETFRSEVRELRARQERMIAERRELDGYEPAVDPDAE
ncbi:MAG TPA: hypothetical protein VFR91_00710 [Dyella sp.]|nr:hypothetical protein [Dyella sp.]